MKFNEKENKDQKGYIKDNIGIYYKLDNNINYKPYINELIKDIGLIIIPLTIVIGGVILICFLL